MTHPSQDRSRSRRSTRRRVAATAALTLASGLLAACSGSDSGTPELVWYINPDAGGQDAVAANCTDAAEGEYTISTQVLPQASDQQRIQLARRIAAGDPGIDLMSLDPPFTAEFADAGFLADIPADVEQTLTDQSFEGAVDAGTWGDQLAVFPFWSNTQVLWYRKSFVEKAGIDMAQPVTWDQIIDAASENGGQIGVQANKYEGYVVWINALISGAGGALVENADQGAEAEITINSDAGKEAARIIEKLASSEAAPPDLSVSNEGTAATTFASDVGSFLVNWTYIISAYPDLTEDIGYTTYPQTVDGEEAAPPYGGIGIGVSEDSDEKELALKAAECLVSPDNQGLNAELTGNMPASAGGYEWPALQESTRRTCSSSSRTASSPPLHALRPPTGATSPAPSRAPGIHPARSNENTPDESATFIDEILHGEKLL